MIRKQTYTKNLFSIARYVRDGPVDEKKDSRVDAVSIGDTKHTSKLQYWEIITPTLETALQYYVGQEEYDVCVVCRDLISKL